MKNFQKKLYCYLFFMLLAFVAPLSYASNLTKDINNIIYNFNKKHPNHINFGIVIHSLKNNKTLYKRNAQRLYTPASVLKLFTATAALAYLKPDYLFNTRLYTTGTIHRDTLNGNLYVKFSGDPLLTLDQLEAIIIQLHQQGISTIKGHIYVDDSDYNSTPYPPGWIWDDLSYSFAAPLSAIIIDQNKFIIHIKPANKINAAPNISSTLPAHLVTFINHIKTVNHTTAHCPIVIYSNNRNQYTLKGCINQKTGTQRRSLAIRNITRFAEYSIQNALHNYNIKYTGSIREKALPRHHHLFFSHPSVPLSAVIHEMLKESDNLTTNSVFKKIGEQYNHTQGTWQNSIRAVEGILALPTTINFKRNRINDGSGLSRYDLVTPKQLIKLLNYAYHNKLIFPALFNALPIAGKDGTLIDRMAKQKKSDHIHAKTGSMTGVLSLAGYIKTSSYGNLSFAIMMNNLIEHNRKYMALEDKICAYLAAH